MFLHSVLTGLQNYNIRNDLRPYLQQPDINDEVLLEKLNTACMVEAERQKKKKDFHPQQSVGAHTVQCTEAPLSSEKRGKTSENKTEPDLLAELKEIKAKILHN